MKRNIRIGFVDFWDGFDVNDNFFVNLLSRRYNVEVSDSPDYLFYSVFGSEHLRYDCVSIFYTGENQSPDFNLCDYALGFEYISFGDRYFRLPNYILYPGDYIAMEKKHTHSYEELTSGRDGFCSFVYSNNNASPERSVFLDLLSEYKLVSSGGRLRNNVGGPVADKNAFQRKYKFSITFENISHEGYTTEKLVQAFAAGSVPIYWGDPRVAEVFNSKAFINCHDYSSLEEVVDVVKKIDGDDDLYRFMQAQPALKDVSFDYNRQLEALLDFLSVIFDQPLDKAGRYSRQYWCARYRANAISRERAFSHSLKGVAERIYKKTLWQWRNSSIILWKLDRIIKRR